MTRRRALLIACDEYDDPKLSRLRSPAHDVQVLARLLGDPTVGAYDVRLLVNPTEHEARLEIARLLRSAGRSDHLLLFFACHGRRDIDGLLYLALADTDVDDLPATALPTELINRLLNRSACQRMVLLLDCCFSGAVSRVLTHQGDAGVRGGDLFPGEGTGRAVLTATTAHEYAWEPAGEPLPLTDNPRHSVFAGAVIEGLRTGDADLDGDGLVSADELYRYVRDSVAVAGGQTPRRWMYGEGDLYVARSSRGPALATAAGRTAPLPPAGVEVRDGRGADRSDGPVPPSQRPVPWTAERLHWEAGLPEPVERMLRGLADRTGWLALRAGGWDEATARFEAAVRVDGTAGAWWGLGISHAIGGRWQAAGHAFAAAAGGLREAPPDHPVPTAALTAGALLLAVVTLRAGGDQRAAQVLTDSVNALPLCPPLLVLSAAWAGDGAALTRAFLLDPEMAVECEAADMEIGPAVQEAIACGEAQFRRLDVARTRLRATDPAWSGGPAGDGGPEGVRRSPLARLREVRRTVEVRRDELISLLHARQLGVRDALRAPVPDGGGAVVADIRNAIHAGHEALRATDRPAPLAAVGIPPIRPMRLI
ncbi:caspase family protein [Micromonospora parva]|uniref:caspase family protein n=1 Tax=Micromonospora parva TaxID=1464048 RepID=UPI0033F84E90